MSRPTTDVIVVGAGLAGLAAACHLRGRGHHVTVVEREPAPGGRAARSQHGDYAFDIGPTVMTMPDLLDSALRAVGTTVDETVPMRRLDPAYRARFHDGSTILVRAGHEAMRDEIRRACGSVDAAAYDGFVAWLRQLYAVEMPHFIDRNFDAPADILDNPRAVARLLRLGALRRLGPMIRDRFQDPRLRRLFTFQAMYAGLPPETALSIYAVITYMDTVEGVYFPEGGMVAIAAGLAAAAERAGVDLRYGAEVTELLQGAGDGAVCGVRLADGETLHAPVVVCTLDLPVAYERLLPDLEPPRAVRRGNYSPSAVVWHVGTRSGIGADAAHHNIHFGEEWNAAFDALLGRRELMPDPSRLVTVPSLTDPALAAAGGTTMYVLEPVPNLQGGQDWTRERGPMRDRLMAFLSAQGYPTDVVAEELWTPADWARLGMARGTPFALAHTVSQTGPLRPSNVERRVPGLVFAGSGTVPGVGVPMVLISGKLAADRVDELVPPGGRR